VLQLNQGTLYPALLRMEQEGWIAAKWGASERTEARFYSITAARENTARKRNRGLETYVLPQLNAFLALTQGGWRRSTMSWASVITARNAWPFQRNRERTNSTTKFVSTCRCK